MAGEMRLLARRKEIRLDALHSRSLSLQPSLRRIPSHRHCFDAPSRAKPLTMALHLLSWSPLRTFGSPTIMGSLAACRWNSTSAPAPAPKPFVVPRNAAHSRGMSCLPFCRSRSAGWCCYLDGNGVETDANRGILQSPKPSAAVGYRTARSSSRTRRPREKAASSKSSRPVIGKRVIFMRLMT